MRRDYSSIDWVLTDLPRMSAVREAYLYDLPARRTINVTPIKGLQLAFIGSLAMYGFHDKT